MKHLAWFVVLASVLVGCQGEADMPKEEVADKSKMTAIASKAVAEHKDWTALTADEKSSFTKFYKDEAKSKEAFDKIVNGLKYFSAGGGPAPGR